MSTILPPPSSPSSSRVCANVKGGWTRRISKMDTFPSSLPSICARMTALRGVGESGHGASIIPLLGATCSPLYLIVEADEVQASQRLGLRAEYENFSEPLEEQDAAQCLLSVAQLLSEMHSRGVIHGHLHAGVLLRHITHQQRLLVTEGELPMSSLVPQGATGRVARQCAAPEIIRGDPYSATADVWGLAVLLIQLRLGSAKPIFTADLEDSDLLSPFVSSLSPTEASAVLPCLKSDPQQRPLLHELFQHPLFVMALRRSSSGSHDVEDDGVGDDACSSSGRSSSCDASEEDQEEERADDTDATSDGSSA